jgi:hypothetical protein
LPYQLGRFTTEINPSRARNVFSAFRRTIRPDMLWGPFVSDLTFELFNFYKKMVAGERPKLAISTPPQHGKSWSAEDLIAWVAGRHPNWKTIYASYSDELGVMRNLNLQRLIMSERYRAIFPGTVIGQAGWQFNTSVFEYVKTSAASVMPL